MKLEVQNVNYCATIVSLSEFIPIPNKDKIQSTLIFSNNVVVSTEAKKGDIGIYFPVECKINPEFLKMNNIFKDSELNSDKELKGFFEVNCRVKALRLGGIKSEGFFIPLNSIKYFCDINNLKIGDEFNSIDGIEICTKYTIVEKKQSSNSKGNNDRIGKTKRFVRLIENQFNFHINTPLLQKNIHCIKPNSVISITNKLHGTSAIFSNVLINKKLTFFEKVLKFLKFNVVSTEYSDIYSSRTVIKNKYINENVSTGFYDEDLWGVVNNEIKSKIPKSYTIYGEIVGYTSSGKCIQKGYHYGCEPKKHKLYVYRVTITNVDGLITELGWSQLKDFCSRYGFDLVPEFYFGYAKCCFNDIQVNDNWSEEFIKRLSISFNMNDAKCELNNKEVPAEGLVIRVENAFKFDAYKHKNFAFKSLETKQFDAGVVDMESLE